MVTIIIILAGFGLIPVQAASLIQTIANHPKYLSSLSINSSSRHVCLCGIVDYELLSRFLTELLHPTHMPEAVERNLIVVILSPTKPTDSVSVLLRLSQYKNRVHFFIGSCKSSADLRRIQLQKAMAVYMVADSVTSSLRAEEDSVFLSAISITKFLRQQCWRGHKRINSKSAKDKQCSSPLLAKLADCFFHLTGGNTFAGEYEAYIVNKNQARKSSCCTLRKEVNSYPRTLVKLGSSARCRPVLESAGIDAVLSLQVM